MDGGKTTHLGFLFLKNVSREFINYVTSGAEVIENRFLDDKFIEIPRWPLKDATYLKSPFMLMKSLSLVFDLWLNLEKKNCQITILIFCLPSLFQTFINTFVVKSTEPEGRNNNTRL